MLCGNCGHDNANDNRFCGMCGMRLERIPVHKRESSRSEYRELVRERVGTPPRESPDVHPLEAERTPEPPKEVISFDPPERREYGSRDDVQSARGNGNTVESPRPRQRASTGPSFLNLEVPAEPPREERQPAQTISGPSFLGLADEGASRDESRYNIDYLLEDEPRESHWRVWLVLIILGLFGVLAWLQLRHAGVDVASLMQRLRTAKESIMQEKQRPTTGSADAAPAEPEKPAQPAQAPAGQNAAATTANGTNPASAGNQSTTTPGQSASADATKNDTAKSGDQAKSAQGSDLAAKGNSGAVPEMKPAAKPDEAAADKSSDKSSGDEEASDATPAKPASNATVAKNTAPKKPAAGVDDSEARAARAQNAQGATLVATGEKYLYGRGVSQNCERAISYLRKASDMGNAKGSSHLGAMYATGNCLPMDRVRAYKYFAQALHQDSSNPYFQHNLEMLWNEMSPDEKQQATARTPAQ